jgi:hypothetical protein
MGKTWHRVHWSVDENEISYAKTTWRVVDTDVIKKEFKLGKTSSGDLNDRRKVFKIYTSGSTLYAVARSAGC